MLGLSFSGSRSKNGLWRKPLVFPTGHVAGVDPAHMMSNKLEFSGVAANNAFMRTNVTDTLIPITYKIDPILGPVCSYSPNCSQYSKIVNVGDATTFAAIIKVDSILSTNTIISTSYLDFVVYGGYLAAGISGTLVLTTIPITAGVPYFVAMSIFNNTCTAIAVELNTGKTYVYAGSSYSGITSYTDVICIGNTPYFNYPLYGSIAAAAYGRSPLSIPQLQIWAKDPWAFWYPENTTNLGGFRSGINITVVGLSNNVNIGSVSLTSTSSVLNVNIPGVTTNATLGSLVQVSNVQQLIAGMKVGSLTGSDLDFEVIIDTPTKTVNMMLSEVELERFLISHRYYIRVPGRHEQSSA